MKKLILLVILVYKIAGWVATIEEPDHTPQILYGPGFHYENTPIQIYGKFHLQKTEFFQIKTPIFFIFLLKKQIVGTRLNRFGEAVLTSTHNLCFMQ